MVFWVGRISFVETARSRKIWGRMEWGVGVPNRFVEPTYVVYGRVFEWVGISLFSI
jgi:hypothetical protein